MTVKEHRGSLSGLKIAIIGDIAHSRVAHSDIIGFTAWVPRCTSTDPPP
jgi:aspartate carbamoyltransferase catalytic subunit